MPGDSNFLNLSTAISASKKGWAHILMTQPYDQYFSLHNIVNQAYIQQPINNSYTYSEYYRNLQANHSHASQR
jgi:hypothetical protein